MTRGFELSTVSEDELRNYLDVGICILCHKYFAGKTAQDSRRARLMAHVQQRKAKCADHKLLWKRLKEVYNV
jgi:nitrate/TMAO reductase-like tetraheme cytochrome c subunit